MRGAMRFALTAVAVSGACGDGGNDGAQGGAAPVGWISELMFESDRVVVSACECLAASGAYGSMQECIDANTGDSNGSQCAIDLFADSDAGPPQADARCLIDELAARSDCFEQSGCDQEVTDACPSVSVECLAKTNELSVYVLQSCPDAIRLPP